MSDNQIPTGGVYITSASFPKVKSIIRVSPDLTIRLTSPMPNRWRRWWYWALLGWTWEVPK